MDQKLEKLIKKRDYEQASQLGREAEEYTKETFEKAREENLRERAEESIKGVEFVISETKEMGADVSEAESRLKEMNALCICVPTPLTQAREPDLSYVIRQSEELSRYLQPGQLVVLESTTHPGTTREIVQPILEKSGLKAGRNFYLAYSPERADPGNRKYSIRNTPKVVGGIDATSATWQ